jgi:predicted amidohydrolase YtcJ
MKRREADRILFNGAIVTVDSANTIAEAVAVKDGKIAAVGTEDEVMQWRGTGTELTDLEGKTVLPGFVEPHSHLSFVGVKLNVANLSPPPVGPVGSLADLKQALREYKESKDLKPGDWIMGMGYDDTAMTEQRHPTREDLDEVSSEYPIFCLHISAHLAAVNSKALEIAGIDENTPDPDGGAFQRLPGSQVPSGVAEELAMFSLFAVLSTPTEEEAVKEIEDAVAYYASHGTTTAHDAAIKSQEQLALFRKMADEGRLDIDIVGWPLFNVADQMLANFEQDRIYRGRFRLGGLKLLLDGSIQGYTAFLSQPYYVQPGGDEPVGRDDIGEVDQLLVQRDAPAGAPPLPRAEGGDYRGYPTFESQPEITGWLTKAYEKGWPVQVHTNGDGATDMLIEAVRQAEAAYPGQDRRVVIVHAQTMREDQLDAAAELGMSPTFFPSHVYYWGDRHRDIFLGPERAARINPLRSALDRGIVFTGHHDAPVTPADMLVPIWAAVNRVTASGELLGPEQRIPVIEAIRAATINGAYQLFEEETKGSIEVGKVADFVVLSENPLQVDPMTIKDIQVLETIKEGKTIFKL